MLITACDLLHDLVLPFYEALGVTVQALLTDNGREFCGRKDSLLFELLLQLEEVEHRTTRVRTPRTNGFVERMNKTLLDECFRVYGRTKWYTAVDEIQADLDTSLRGYNEERSHQGYRLNGRTPTQGLREALGRDQLPPVVPKSGSGRGGRLTHTARAPGVGEIRNLYRPSTRDPTRNDLSSRSLRTGRRSHQSTSRPQLSLDLRSTSDLRQV